ncbi:hypothetical protein [Paenibacillus sp. 1P03SA]
MDKLNRLSPAGAAFFGLRGVWATEEAGPEANGFGLIAKVVHILKK